MIASTQVTMPLWVATLLIAFDTAVFIYLAVTLGQQVYWRTVWRKRFLAPREMTELRDLVTEWADERGHDVVVEMHEIGVPGKPAPYDPSHPRVVELPPNPRSYEEPNSF